VAQVPQHPTGTSMKVLLAAAVVAGLIWVAVATSIFAFGPEWSADRVRRLRDVRGIAGATTTLLYAIVLLRRARRG